MGIQLGPAASTEHITKPLTLAILCGGRSQRLGTDKGLYRPLGDESLVVRGIRRWHQGFSEVLLVVFDNTQAAFYQQEIENNLEAPLRTKVRIVTDCQEEALPRSPLTGILSACQSTSHSSVVVLPVDQVAVRPRHLNTLAATESGAAAFAFDSDIIPFPSLWRSNDKLLIRVVLREGKASVRGCLQRLTATIYDAGAEASALAVNGNTKEALQAYFGEEPLIDPQGRRMHYLRFSLTEACNMSCQYCLPDGFPEWYRHKARLALPDIETLLKGFRHLGFRKVRFTGGEPTVHPKALQAVKLARDTGFERIAMTTNGTLIEDLVPWLAAGLDQINVSLDSLNPETFWRQTKSHGHAKVLRLIDDALDLGLTVKVNTVLMRSVNVSEAPELIDWALAKPLTLRFIELMPTGLNKEFFNREVVYNTELAPLLAQRGLSLRLGDPKALLTDGPAVDYACAGVPGRIGLINPLSCNFCDTCNRLRVTARGGLKLCLFGDHTHQLDLTSPGAVAQDVKRLLGLKKKRHHLETGAVGDVATFRTIGG